MRLFSQRLLIIAAFLTAVAPLRAITVQQSAVGAAASDQGCSITRQAVSFAPSERQVFFWFIAQQVRATDQLKVEWIDPDGKVAVTANYETLPAAPSLCLLTQLPLAGFAPANQPGTWAVRAVSGGSTLISRTFEIQKDPSGGSLSITSVTRHEPTADGTEILLDGRGFEPGMIVHIAQYTKTGGWNYIAALTPTSVSETKVTAKYNGVLGPGEYMAIVRDINERLSNPSRIIVSTNSGYRMPFAGGETWQITQVPYGSFSHWGNVVNAFDIAPMAGACVVAMRAGTVYAFDRGEVQSHTNRSFGNYITIDHGDGEYSQYAHLARGTFVVKTGQHVEAGQALAHVGNSGYTLGEGGGYHVHAEVTKSFNIVSQSIPFTFTDVPHPAKGMVVKSTQPAALGDCTKKFDGPITTLSQSTPSAALVNASIPTRPTLNGPHFQGEVGVGDWWHSGITVPKGATHLDVRLEYTGKGRELNLHLVSPSNKHYGWYGDKTGYTGQGSNPEEFDIPTPEIGTWRVSVQGTKGTGEVMDFAIESATPTPPPARPRTWRAPLHAGGRP
ncbi:MAG TPA: peptidoglycan DD-metalloendopeptidase family protein [Bryobacteraceae bacterium]